MIRAKARTKWVAKNLTAHGSAKMVPHRLAAVRQTKPQQPMPEFDNQIRDSARGELTDAELVILQNLDLAMLSRYEQAKNLTITLLKRWLVQYKFRYWQTHSTDPSKRGQAVTEDEKQARAEEIARMLSDNKLWHSHGRKIGVTTLQDRLRLKIEDYSNDSCLRVKVRAYSEFITDYINRHGHQVFLHSRRFF